jgi:hypothetical protein
VAGALQPVPLCIHVFASLALSPRASQFNSNALTIRSALSERVFAPGSVLVHGMGQDPTVSRLSEPQSVEKTLVVDGFCAVFLVRHVASLSRGAEPGPAPPRLQRRLGLSSRGD